jgi:hypothetical protein
MGARYSLVNSSSILSFSSLLIGTTLSSPEMAMHQVQLKRGPIAVCFTWFESGLYFSFED